VGAKADMYPVSRSLPVRRKIQRYKNVLSSVGQLIQYWPENNHNLISECIRLVPVVETSEFDDDSTLFYEGRKHKFTKETDEESDQSTPTCSPPNRPRSGGRGNYGKTTVKRSRVMIGTKFRDVGGTERGEFDAHPSGSEGSLGWWFSNNHHQCKSSIFLGWI